MGKAVARLGDLIGTWTAPGAIIACALTDVYVNGIPIATKNGSIVNVHYSDAHAEGHIHLNNLYVGGSSGGPSPYIPCSLTVFAGGQGVARIYDSIACILYSNQQHKILTAQGVIGPAGQTVFAGD